MKIIHNTENQVRVEIEKVSDRPFYSMEYHGDYYFNKYLSKGVCNLDEFCTFINETLIVDSKKKLKREKFGCGVFTAHNLEGDVILFVIWIVNVRFL